MKSKLISLIKEIEERHEKLSKYIHKSEKVRTICCELSSITYKLKAIVESEHTHSNKTPEKILEDFGCGEIPNDEMVTMYYPAIISAMKEYAEQSLPSEQSDAVEFKTWLETQIEVTREDKDLQREHWAFCKCYEQLYNKPKS